MLASGWTRAGDTTPTYLPYRGEPECLDHLLHTGWVSVSAPEALTAIGGHALEARNSALSNHAALRTSVITAAGHGRQRPQK
jgi:hypothetical protein